MGVNACCTVECETVQTLTLRMCCMHVAVALTCCSSTCMLAEPYLVLVGRLDLGCAVCLDATPDRTVVELGVLLSGSFGFEFLMF